MALNYGEILSQGLAGVAMVVKIFVPLIIVSVLFLVALYIIRKKKIYNVEVRILSKTADNNLVEGEDRGGVTKREDVEEFRLLRRKIAMPIPERKFWILNEKGNFSIYFFKHSEHDFEPIEPRLIKKDWKKLFRKYVRGDIKEEDEEYKKLKNEVKYNALDIKGDLADVYFEPIKADSKHFHLIKGREMILKHDTSSKLERLAPLAGYAFIGVVLIFLIIWYFQSAEKLTNKAFAQSQQSIEKADEVLRRTEEILDRLGDKATGRIPTEDVEPPPF